MLDQVLNYVSENKSELISLTSKFFIVSSTAIISFFAYKWVSKITVQSCMNSFYNHQEIDLPINNILTENRMNTIENNIKYIRFKKESQFNSYIFEHFLDTFVNSPKNLFLNNFEDIISSPHYFVLIKNVFFFNDCAKQFLDELPNNHFKHQIIKFISDLADCETFQNFVDLNKDKEIIWLINDFTRRTFFRGWF